MLKKCCPFVYCIYVLEFDQFTSPECIQLLLDHPDVDVALDGEATALLRCEGWPCQAGVGGGAVDSIHRLEPDHAGSHR